MKGLLRNCYSVDSQSHSVAVLDLCLYSYDVLTYRHAAGALKGLYALTFSILEVTRIPKFLILVSNVLRLNEEG